MSNLLSFLSLLPCLLLLQLVTAVDPPQLQVQVNQGLATGSKRMLLGSIATIKGLSTWSDEQITDLAFAAHVARYNAHAAIDFNSNPAYRGLSRKRPQATSTLIIEDTAYIASSMVGGTYLYKPGTRVGGNTLFYELDPTHPCSGDIQVALEKCQARSTAHVGHRTGAACGEVMAALAFCATGSQRNFAGGKIITIFGDDPEDGPNPSRIIPPCGNPEGQLKYEGEFGCHDFTQEISWGLKVIAPGTTRQVTVVADEDIVVTYATYP